MIDLENLGERELDKLFAKKFDISDRTVRNYKKLEDPKVIVPTGKIHLYKAMYLYMYLTEYGTYIEDGEEVCEHNNRIDLLLANLESLESNLKLKNDKNNNFDENIKQAIDNSIENSLKVMKEVLEGISCL